MTSEGVLAICRPIVGGILIGASAVALLALGIGWGLAGLCPGPALTALASGEPRVLLFVAAMSTGTAVQKLVERTVAARTAAHPSTTSMLTSTRHGS